MSLNEPRLKRAKLTHDPALSAAQLNSATSSTICRATSTSAVHSHDDHSHCSQSNCQSNHSHNQSHSSSPLSSFPPNLSSQSIADSLNPSLPEPNGLINLSIGELPEKGRAMFTHSSVNRHQVLLRDDPLSFLQFQASSRLTLSCHQCGRFIGSLMDQIAMLTNGKVRLSSLPNLSEHDALLSLIVECPQHCGVRYCSERCRSVSWFKHHELLCTGPRQPDESVIGSPHSQSVARAIHQSKRVSFHERVMNKKARRAFQSDDQAKVTHFHVLQHFHNHAMRNHQFFMMAAQIVATLVSQQRRGSDIEACLKSLSLFHSKPWWDCVNLDEGFEMPEDLDEIDLDELSDDDEGSLTGAGKSLDERLVEAAKKQHRKETKEHLISVVQKSYDLLCKALFGCHGFAVPDWLTFKFFSCLIGILKLNNISVEVRNPLVEYFQSLDMLNADSKFEYQRSLAPVVLEIVRSHEELTQWEEEQIIAQAEHNDSDSDDEKEDDDEEASQSESGSDTEDDEAPQRNEESSYSPHIFDWTIPASKPISPSVQSTESLSPDLAPLSFPSTIFPSIQGSALFPTLATLNHSCQPNASYAFIDDARGVLIADQDISVADSDCPVELCISYTDVEDVPLAERRAALAEYGFQCTCPKCQFEAELA